MGHRLGEGRLTHRRLMPFLHEFSYPVHMLCLDLDALPEAFPPGEGWGLNRPALASFREMDYLRAVTGARLADRLRHLVFQRLAFAPSPGAWLLTQPRYFGLGFNPVSVLWVGPREAPEALVLEVTNTPWNERHCYVLDARGQTGTLRFREPKAFHVSPFMPMEQSYEFTFAFTNDALRVSKHNLEAGERVFSAHLALSLVPLDRSARRRALWGSPLMTTRVLGAIYWQALWLWLKGARYYGHPGKGKGQS
jgi:DUF1365 family protein